MTREALTPIMLPEAERGRSDYDLRELDRINARLARGYKPHRGKTAEEQREDDLRRRAEVEARATTKRETAETAAGVAESLALAEQRGEEVATDKVGVRRIIDRDPLLSLARAGKLTPRQLETGQEVRDLYDQRAGDLAAMEYTGMPAGRHDHERFVAKRFTKAKASEMAGRVERQVALKCAPVSLVALRWVCERGNSLSSLTGPEGQKGKGRALDRNAAALAQALDVAEAVLRRQA